MLINNCNIRWGILIISSMHQLSRLIFKHTWWSILLRFSSHDPPKNWQQIDMLIVSCLSKHIMDNAYRSRNNGELWLESLVVKTLARTIGSRI